MTNPMVHHRHLNKITAYIFMQRLYVYLLVLRYIQSLTKLQGKDKEQENKAENFGYDSVGNRLTGPEKKDIYTYNNGNQLTSDRKHQYEYDKNGNLTKKTEIDDGETETTTYSYDYENRLIKVVKQESSETKTVSFIYDPFWRRIRKTVEEKEDGKTETKIYDYVYDNEDIILEYLTKAEDGKVKTETTKYIHGTGIDEPLSIERKGEVYYYHADGLGSITALTDLKQKVVESYTYDSFGNMKRKGDKVKNTFTFTGREWDEETGLYYYRARYYDAEVGRFVSFDPISRGFSHTAKVATCSQTISSFPVKQPQKLHPYLYVENNAINLTDPTGLGGVSECEYYNNRCKKTSECDRYACKAYQCCQDWGEGTIINCVRGCLISFDKLHCANLTGEARNQCAALAHFECYGKCNALTLLPLFIYPGGMPTSCKGII